MRVAGASRRLAFISVRGANENEWRTQKDESANWTLVILRSDTHRS
jgi:hypothetical protein